MALGQGARAALPVYGIFMRKVYADKSLKYSQDEKFIFPDGWDPCDGMGGFGQEQEEAAPEEVEGIFE